MYKTTVYFCINNTSAFCRESFEWEVKSTLGFWPTRVKGLYYIAVKENQKEY